MSKMFTRMIRAWVSPEQWAWLEDFAWRNRVSQAHVIRVMLEEARGRDEEIRARLDTVPRA